MIVGDKLKCKNSFYSRITGKITFLKGCYYTITYINGEDTITMSCTNSHGVSFEQIPHEYSISLEHYIWDYFYTIGEVRNQKINSILNN